MAKPRPVLTDNPSPFALAPNDMRLALEKSLKLASAGDRPRAILPETTPAAEASVAAPTSQPVSQSMPATASVRDEQQRPEIRSAVADHEANGPGRPKKDKSPSAQQHIAAMFDRWSDYAQNQEEEGAGLSIGLVRPNKIQKTILLDADSWKLVEDIIRFEYLTNGSKLSESAAIRQIFVLGLTNILPHYGPRIAEIAANIK